MNVRHTQMMAVQIGTESIWDFSQLPDFKLCVGTSVCGVIIDHSVRLVIYCPRLSITQMYLPCWHRPLGSPSSSIYVSLLYSDIH
jgi:hypothetical protein